MLKNLLENVFPLNHGVENNFICINIYCEIISLTGNKKEEGKNSLQYDWYLPCLQKASYKS